MSVAGVSSWIFSALLLYVSHVCEYYFILFLCNYSFLYPNNHAVLCIELFTKLQFEKLL
jgi:hypothetical protein